MKLDDILEAWKKDAVLDDLNVDLVSAEIPKLHSKYVSWLSYERGSLRGLQITRRELIHKLRDYYLGLSTPQDLQELGRSPFLQRVLKNELMEYVESDQSLIDVDKKIALQQEKVEVLLEIMKSIDKRGFTCKGIIDWKRLMVGG